MSRVLAKLATLVGILASTSVHAADLLGLYAGAGGGQAHLRISDVPYAPAFSETATGWTVFAGVKPLPFLGAELQYLDFGHASRVGGFEYDNSDRAKALALFSTWTASLPFVNLYAKAGLGRLQTTTSNLFFSPMQCSGDPNCFVFQSHTDKTAARFGGGAGVELKVSSLALRGEYVQFITPDGDPSLLSVAILWRF